jgi:hypothetical protein
MMPDALSSMGRELTYSVWTIYDHPSDHPTSFVARRFDLSQGEPVLTTDIIMTHSLDDLRRRFADMGLIQFSRAPWDDPAIMETWL